ncbi:DUF1127 domain-containing protein [Rhodobacteraceae bacterium F11138]|nr:DUF1127 domain-containing protein [Rhodobacteraceae bacterium F11138]
MTHIALTPSHGAPLMMRVFYDAKERFARYRLFRATVNELSKLSNRQLADIGLTRSMISSQAHQSAYGQR